MLGFYGYKNGKSLRKIVGTVFIASVLTLGFTQFDKKIMPIAVTMSHAQAKNMANTIIDDAVYNALNTMGIQSKDFFIKNNSENINMFSVDALLINKFCSTISRSINGDMDKIRNYEIKIPIGAASGLLLMSDKGPKMSFALLPMGDTVVDYETSFTSVGINQTNLKIWINVEINVSLVNAIHKEKLVMCRKIMAVDSIINGVVPERYFDLGK